MQVRQIWDYEHPCPYCGCDLKLVSDSASERRKCCRNGAFVNPNSNFPRWVPLPPRLHFYATEYIQHFHRSSAYYSNFLSIGATGVDNGRDTGFEIIHGDHSVTMNGRCYTFMPGLNSMGGLRYFTYDNYPEMAEEARRVTNRSNDQNIREDRLPILPYILRDLFEEQREINIYASELVQIGDQIRRNDEEQMSVDEYLFYHGHHSHLQIDNVSPQLFDVSAVIQDDIQGTQSMSYHFRLNGSDQTIRSDSEQLEALCYPLLNPFGENGWSTALYRNGDRIHLGEYVRARILMPDLINNDISDPQYIEVQNHDGSRRLRVSRCQLMTRLTQYFLVESNSRIIDSRLAWQRANQNYMIGAVPRNADHVDAEGAENDDGEVTSFVNNPAIDRDRVEDSNTNPTYLSESVTGSPRHLRNLALNALGIVAEKGKPHVFITVTANELWPEVQERLLPGQTAYERPDVMAKVFQARLRAILANLKNGKYFCGRTVYILHVIEYQHRGLPHAHIVCQFVDGPNHENEQDCINFIDRYISAQMPILNENSTEEDHR